MDSNTKSRSGERKLFVAIVLVCLIFASPFALLTLYQTPFFYYRHFNRIKAKLEALPDTKIVDSWQHLFQAI
jgi:hypothetical protein